jgi:Gram-negative bacterial TonB protein C-terminal
MKHLSSRLTALVMFHLAFAGTATAQIGPVQPVLVLPHGDPEMPHSRPNFTADYVVPVDVYVGAAGEVQNVVVTQSSGDIEADGAAASFVRDRKFLPGVDVNGQPVDAVLKVNVNMFKRGAKKVVRVTAKPPPYALEKDRVQRMTCADFLWEVERMREGANIKDTSNEITPYMSALLYKEKRNVPIEVEAKFWDLWPDTLDKVVDRCEKQQTRLYFTEVLMPALDGTLPAPETATAGGTE